MNFHKRIAQRIYNDRKWLTSVVEIAKQEKKIASTGFAMTCAPVQFRKGVFQSI